MYLKARARDADEGGDVVPDAPVLMVSNLPSMRMRAILRSFC